MTDREKIHDIKEAINLISNVLEDTDEDTWAYEFLEKAQFQLFNWFEESEI